VRFPWISSRTTRSSRAPLTVTTRGHELDIANEARDQARSRRRRRGALTPDRRCFWTLPSRVLPVKDTTRCAFHRRRGCPFKHLIPAPALSPSVHVSGYGRRRRGAGAPSACATRHSRAVERIGLARGPGPERCCRRRGGQASEVALRRTQYAGRNFTAGSRAS
jgi:hypothetical protein